MIGSPVAAGKRPDFKQAHSGGMGWPRFVPVKDQQPQKPAQSDKSQTERSSDIPSAQDPSEHAISPTTTETPIPDDGPSSPIHSAAGSARSTEDFGTALIKRPDPLGEAASAPTIPGSYAPESSKRPAERRPAESPDENSQAQVDALFPNSVNSATQAINDSHQPEEPSASDEPTIPVLTDPVPYYAKPKIMVHKPSASTLSDISGPRTIDEVLAHERQASSQHGISAPNELTKVDPMPFPDRELPKTQLPKNGFPRVPGTLQSVPALLDNRRVKKALRTTRNVAVRKTILKALLGRQLAEPTKEALRMLAKGEPVDLESLVVPAVS